MPTQLIQRSEESPGSHGWLLAALFAALVIVGLLGMHTLSTAHAESPVAMGAMAMDADHVHAASGSMDADTDAACLDCGTSGPHHAMIMACVLGLLVTLLLVCRAKPGLVRTHGPSIVAPVLWPAIELLPRPPSLTVLSISRT